MTVSAAAVRWHPWGAEVFRQAEAEHKLILLSIGASWCHWCHVMDGTSYSDAEIVRKIERDYVPVRVDTDRRPDINERYNQGGWPTTAFLTPEGEVLYGATYIPPAQLSRLLDQLIDYFRGHHADIAAAVAELRLREEAVQQSRPDLPLDDSLAGQVLALVQEAFDPLHGGFGGPPKFPMPDVLDLLLEQYRRSGGEQWRNMIQLTLAAMSRRGMYDPVEGGFFRYATDRGWQVPHFEKMLEGNAALLGVYLRAFLLLGDPLYAQVAVDVVRYLEQTLADPAGGFYGSQDADESYYALDTAGRSRREPPRVDRTIYAAWNGQLAEALFLGAAALEQAELGDRALATVDRLVCDLRAGDGTFRHYLAGDGTAPPGLLADQVWAGRALLAAYAYSGRRAYLEIARDTVAAMDRLLWDPEQRAYRDRPPEEGSLGRLRLAAYPPVENAVAARTLLGLHLLTGELSYHERAEQVLRGREPLRYGLFAAAHASALWLLLGEPWHAAVVGPADDPRTRTLRQHLMRQPYPLLVLEPLDPASDRARLETLGYPDQEAVAYLCVGSRCLAPARSAAEVSARLAEAGSTAQSTSLPIPA